MTGGQADQAAVQLDPEKPGVLHLATRCRTQVSALESSVLVLNSGYTAVRITNARRAFILLIRDAAEVVTTWSLLSKTYRTEVSVPDDGIESAYGRAGLAI